MLARTGQWTIYPMHAHSASDVWGAVAVSPAFAEESGHTFHDINISGSYGMSYWGEQESNLDLYNVGMNPVGYLAAGGMEQTASWVETIGQLNYRRHGRAGRVHVRRMRTAFLPLWVTLRLGVGRNQRRRGKRDKHGLRGNDDRRRLIYRRRHQDRWRRSQRYYGTAQRNQGHAS